MRNGYIYSVLMLTTHSIGIAQRLCYIAYNDRVLDRVWEEARKAARDDRMSSDWRSEALDRWLVLDMIVSDHSMDALRIFHKHNPASMLRWNSVRR